MLALQNALGYKNKNHNNSKIPDIEMLLWLTGWLFKWTENIEFLK